MQSPPKISRELQAGCRRTRSRHCATGHATPTCAELLKQWAAYESEHEPGWEEQTLTIEGSVLLRDARSPAANQTVA